MYIKKEDLRKLTKEDIKTLKTADDIVFYETMAVCIKKEKKTNYEMRATIFFTLNPQYQSHEYILSIPDNVLRTILDLLKPGDQIYVNIAKNDFTTNKHKKANLAQDACYLYLYRKNKFMTFLLGTQIREQYYNNIVTI